MIQDLEVQMLNINKNINKNMDLSNLYLIFGNKLSSSRINFIQEKINKSDNPSKYDVLPTIELKDPTIALLLSFFLGGLGIDRFYIGDNGLAVCKLVVSILGWIVLLGWIWWLIDLFLIYGATQEKNYQKIIPFL